MEMKSLVANGLLLVFLLASTMEARASDVAVVISAEAGPYQEALEGFKEIVRHRVVSVQTLKGDAAGSRDKLKKVPDPDLVFVVGTSALQVASAGITNIPIVHALAFNPSSVISAGKNVTGISMTPSANQVVSLIKELNQKIRRVGVIYDPAIGGPLFSQARSVLQKEGIQLVGREIHSASEMGAALKALEDEIDLFWLWPDERFLADDILHRIFLFSFERKIPVFGLSERHTDMGALLSLSYASARDMGRQAAELANKLLGGDAATPSLPQVPLRHTKLTLNLKTAGKLSVSVPDSIVRRADNGVQAPVYEEGDWWIFRIKTIHLDGKIEVEEHRVDFRNGKFETLHPVFLSGGDLPRTPSFLPFVSLYIRDPIRNFFDFPLLPGKTWSFKYPRRFYVRAKITSAMARAEVIGRALSPIETPAGVFEAIEISRTDQLTIPAHLTYFYSPQTKSVVKLRGEVEAGDPRSSGRRFELELIAYGTKGSKNKDPR